MENITQIIDYATNFLSSWGLIAGFLLIIFESIIPALPLGVFVGLNMLAFGNFIGFLVSYIATIFGCMCSFFLFKYVIKDNFRKLFKEKTRKKIDNWTKKLSTIELTTLALLLAFPPTPAFLVNIAAGLSGVDSKKYFIALLIGKPAMLFFYGFIAVSFVESLKDPSKFLYVLLLLFGTYVIVKIFERIVKNRK